MSERDSHESYEVFAGWLHWIAVIIVGSLIAITWLMYELAHTWLAPLPRIEQLAPPGRPRLQAYPRLELQTVLAQEREVLHQYQWVDREHGIARIPIERAMEIMADATNSAGASQTGPANARPPARAPPPPDLDRRVGIDQRIGQPLPGDLIFRDTDGRPLRLAELDNGKPLLLAFGYFSCPNLCDTQLHSM